LSGKNISIFFRQTEQKRKKLRNINNYNENDTLLPQGSRGVCVMLLLTQYPQCDSFITSCFGQ